MKENEKANKKVTNTMKIKQNVKGITLIALVVTIVILLILATVTINLAIGQNGLFGRARNGVNVYKQAEANESDQLDYLINEMDDAQQQYGEGTTGGGSILANGDKISDSIRKKASDNTELRDDNGNTVWLPKDFKISTDSATAVAGGVVIEDGSGNQFVWIPIGTISTTAKGSNDKTITLGRYTFDTTNGTSTLKQNATDYTTDVAISTYYHELETSSYGNATAKSLSSFITSATSKGGYYLARYEAGVGTDTTLNTTDMVNTYTAPNTNWTGYTNGKIVSQAGKQVWNYITQNKASELARNMYSTNTNIEATIDLVNSYAWDTAIVFIEQCGANSNYANKVRLQTTLANTGKATDGTSNDVQCNIYDMAGNVYEWITESYSSSVSPCVGRGGVYSTRSLCTASRSGYPTTSAYANLGFRPLLYL